MTVFFRLPLAGLLASPLLSGPAGAQNAAPPAGRLHYETTQRVDQSKVKITMLDNNGQEIKTDGPGSTIELPSSISAQQSLVYSGKYAKEERATSFQMAGGNITITPTKSAAAPRAVQPALTETQYFDLAARTTTAVTTIGGTAYAPPAAPIPTPPPRLARPAPDPAHCRLPLPQGHGAVQKGNLHVVGHHRAALHLFASARAYAHQGRGAGPEQRPGRIHRHQAHGRAGG